MSKVVWIASYPKSGNTWVRFLVCNLLFGRIESAAALNRLVPDIHELAAAPEPPTAPIFMKTHFTYSAHLPLASHTAGAIYVMREPADVMLSNFHYSKRSGALPDNPAAFERYFDSYIANGGDPRWRRMGMGSWLENVRSWIDATQHFPVLRIRYEDLLTQGTRVADLICRSVNAPRTPEAIAEAVAAASFDRMRQIEEADIAAQRVGIFFKPYLGESIASGLRFMRSGRSGEAGHALSPEQSRQFNEVFGSLRQELGYL